METMHVFTARLKTTPGLPETVHDRVKQEMFADERVTVTSMATDMSGARPLKVNVRLSVQADDSSQGAQLVRELVGAQSGVVLADLTAGARNLFDFEDVA